MSAKKILIVEDSSIISIETKTQLQKLGYEVVAAVESGEEAVAIVQQSNPDLILMDIMLSGSMDGIQAAGIIKQSMDVPILFTTAFSDPETIDRAKGTRPYGFLMKPFDEKELMIAIEISLQTHEYHKLLKENEKKYRTLFEESKDAIYVRDQQGHFVDVNRAMTDLFGYDKGEMLSLSLDSLYFNAEEMGRFNKEITERGFVKDFVERFKRKDGTEIMCLSTSNKIQSNGREGLYQGIIRDITDYIQADHDRKESYRRLHLAIDGIVHAIAMIVESRDPYTSGHQKRVAELAEAIAVELALPQDQIAGIRMAGMIHDLGKTSIPSEILSKPGKISELELSLIRTHPRTGYDILKNIDFPWPISDIILQHHERIDGSGYPDGRQGDEILLEARIIGVADVVEAMASHRPYRPALGVAAALSEIEKNSGSLYDATVVNACLSVFSTGRFAFSG